MGSTIQTTLLSGLSGLSESFRNSVKILELQAEATKIFNTLFVFVTVPTRGEGIRCLNVAVEASSRCAANRTDSS
jgi:hypothetical protein